MQGLTQEYLEANTRERGMYNSIHEGRVFMTFKGQLHFKNNGKTLHEASLRKHARKRPALATTKT